MNIFDYINENFMENLTDTYVEWDRFLEKGLVLPNDNYFDMPGLTTSSNAKVYVFGRIEYFQSILNEFYPNLGFLNNPVDFEQKINTVKTTNLKMSIFPAGIDIDEAFNAAVPV